MDQEEKRASRSGEPFLQLRGTADEVIADAETSLGRTPEERYAMWLSVQRMVGLIWSGLSEEEMERRLEIGERVDPRPDPWWRLIRADALP